MKKTLISIAAAVLLFPMSGFAQVSMSISVPLPPVPSLYVVTPGVQVVEDSDDEVYFHGGYYWARRDAHWYRARGPRDHFAYVQPHYVPAGLVGIPHGHYRRWHHERGGFAPGHRGPPPGHHYGGPPHHGPGPGPGPHHGPGPGPGPHHGPHHGPPPPPHEVREHRVEARHPGPEVRAEKARHEERREEHRR